MEHITRIVVLFLASMALMVSSASALSRVPTGFKMQKNVMTYVKPSGKLVKMQAYAVLNTPAFIENKYSGLCLGIKYGSNVAGARVAQGTCLYTHKDMVWTLEFVPTGGNGWGVWYYVNDYTHLCLSFAGNGYYNGTPIIQWYCDITHQYDQLTMLGYSGGPNGNYWFQIGHGDVGGKAPSTYQVVDDPGWSRTIGQTVDGWQNNFGANQAWAMP